MEIRTRRRPGSKVKSLGIEFMERFWNPSGNPRNIGLIHRTRLCGGGGDGLDETGIIRKPPRRESPHCEFPESRSMMLIPSHI